MCADGTHRGARNAQVVEDCGNTATLTDLGDGLMQSGTGRGDNEYYFRGEAMSKREAIQRFPTMGL